MRTLPFVGTAVVIAGCATASSSERMDDVVAALQRIERDVAQLTTGRSARNAAIQAEIVALELRRVGLNVAERAEVDAKIAMAKRMLIVETTSSATLTSSLPARTAIPSGGSYDLQAASGSWLDRGTRDETRLYEYAAVHAGSDPGSAIVVKDSAGHIVFLMREIEVGTWVMIAADGGIVVSSVPAR